jgi:hypothetical protein
MWATSDGPRAGDFGLSEEDLAGVPRAFLGSHWPMVLGILYLVAAVVLCGLIFHVGRSWPAAVFFTVMALAAGSILLLPLALAAVCVGERAEERWLCRKLPMVRACLAYRGAREDHDARLRRGERRRENPNWWILAGPREYRDAVGESLKSLFPDEVRELDCEASGIDFLVTIEDPVVVRCFAGTGTVPASIGREVAAVLGDRSASAAVIVASGDPSGDLADYVSTRSMAVVRPWEIETAF